MTTHSALYQNPGLWVYANHLSVIKMLLDHGAKLAPLDYAGSSISIQPRNIALIKLLLSYGADVNARDSQSETWLHNATAFYSSAQYLIARGADATARDKDGNTPLHKAVSHWGDFQTNQDVVELLLANGARANAKNHAGQTPLSLALEHEKYAIANRLQHSISRFKS